MILRISEGLTAHFLIALLLSPKVKKRICHKMRKRFDESIITNN
jgi:hypothetical protein